MFELLSSENQSCFSPYFPMRIHRGRGDGRGGGNGGNRQISSYASLATGPPPSYIERERADDNFRGGSSRGGRGRGRGRGRGSRGRGRGFDGRGSFRGGRDVNSGERDRDRYASSSGRRSGRGSGPTSSSHSDTNIIKGNMSNTAAAATSVQSKSGDDSGYESGELSPSPPKPVATNQPRRLSANPNRNITAAIDNQINNPDHRQNNERKDFVRRGRFEDRGGVDSGSDYNSHRDVPPSRYTDDRDRDRPPFESRGSFGGGRGDYDNSGRGRGRGDFDGRSRGGRGRGRLGGRFDVGVGRGRGGGGGRFYDHKGIGAGDGGRRGFGGRVGDRREPFRGMEDLPPRDGERDRPSLLQPRRDGPRDMSGNGPIRDGPRDLSRRDGIFNDGVRELLRRDESFRDGPRELHRRDEMFRDSPREMPRRDEFREFPRRDEHREFPNKEELNRDVPRDQLKDAIRDFSQKNVPTRDSHRAFPHNDGLNRDGGREFLHKDGSRELQQLGPRDYSLEGPRDGSRDLYRRNENSREIPRDFARRDDPRRDGSRDSLRRDGPHDLRGRDEMIRDGLKDPPRDEPRGGPRDLRDPIYSRDDDRYQTHGRPPPMLSGAYRNNFNETDLQKDYNSGYIPENDRFGKRERDERDFRQFDRDDKRLRSTTGGVRNQIERLERPGSNHDDGAFRTRESLGDMGKPLYDGRGFDDTVDRLRFGRIETGEVQLQTKIHRSESRGREIQGQINRNFHGNPKFGERSTRLRDDNMERNGALLHNDDGALEENDAFRIDLHQGRRNLPPAQFHRPDFADGQKRVFCGRDSRSSLSNATDRDRDLALKDSQRRLLRGEFHDQAENNRINNNESKKLQMPMENRSRSPPFSASRTAELNERGDPGPNGPFLSERNQPSDRGRGRGGRGAFRGRGRGRSNFGRGGGEYGRNYPPSSQDREGRETNSIPSYHRNEVPDRNRWPKDETQHHSSAPSSNKDRRDQQPLPSFSSYGQMALSESKPTSARVVTSSTTTPVNSGPVKKNANKSPGTFSTNSKGATKKPEVKELKPPPGPRPPTPPPKGSPSGVMIALARLVELEASMEYAYAKHMMLVKRGMELKEQYDVLRTLPVGIEAIKEDLEKYRPGGAQ